ncbi:MAG: FAD-binding protein [Ruminococcus sp.]|nr:FAD-binding protein [Ruminococcus sp.]
MEEINILGAGLAGLSAAITLAQGGQKCRLISAQSSERAQSVMAEGGINAALDLMGEGDSPELHFEDTMRGGAYLADEEAVRRLTFGAPDTVRWLAGLGVPFNMKDGRLVQRSFGGQKKKRTAYARSSTGKMIMSALIDECRKYECSGLVKRFDHHGFLGLNVREDSCLGLRARDIYSGEVMDFSGRVIMCCGGPAGLFPGLTTGTAANSGYAAARLFEQGVVFGNLEMLQYHPTTVAIPDKRCLVTEAARGEGGRLFIMRNGKRWYFMEEKYPELKNLMPRDVVAREMYFVRKEPDSSGEVMLDMTGLDGLVWRSRLPDLRAELIHYLGIDPAKEPVPVREGIHYFMGGIYTDIAHRTSLRGLYAAGECTCQYHGANRLGGNSMLGAVFGGRTAAEDILCDGDQAADFNGERDSGSVTENEPSDAVKLELGEILYSGLGIVRSAEGLCNALDRLDELEERRGTFPRTRLARAMLLSAMERKESRGAHYREDHPERDEKLGRPTLSRYKNGVIEVSIGEGFE